MIGFQIKIVCYFFEPQNFGEVVDYNVDEDYPALTIRYKSRKDAEMALAQGRSFTGASLSVSWHMPPGSVPKVKDHVAAEEEDEHSAGRIEGSASAEEDEEDENEVSDLDEMMMKRSIGQEN